MRLLATVVGAAALLFAASAPAAVVWSAGMETGDISEWGPHSSQDTGACSRSVTTERAHSGTHSLKLTIDTSGGLAACRQHRNEEAKSGNTYYYSAWYYYPAVFFPVKEQYNVFQFKSHGTTYPAPQPFWSIEATQSPLTFALNWKGGDVSDTDGIAGPYENSTISQKEYRSTTQVPIGRWFQIEAYLVQSGEFTGTLQVWIDGTLVWDFQNVRTKWPGGDQRWSVNNYSNALDPPVATIFIDDARISTERGDPAGNAAPTCTSTALTTTQDIPGQTAPLCSDPDPGTTLTYGIVAQGTKGTASVVGGLLHYVPNAGETGSDSFTYQASDGIDTSPPATVAVTITSTGVPLAATLLATGDGTRSAVIKTESGATVDLFAAIDEPVAASDNGSTYIHNLNKTSGSHFVLLTDLPSGFTSMTGLRIDIRARTTGRNDDSTTLFAQLFAADEQTPLTNEVPVAVNPGLSAWTTISGVTFTGVVGGSKPVWDGARLRLRWLHTPVGVADTTQVRLTAVEVRASYAGS